MASLRTEHPQHKNLWAQVSGTFPIDPGIYTPANEESDLIRGKLLHTGNQHLRNHRGLYRKSPQKVRFHESEAWIQRPSRPRQSSKHVYAYTSLSLSLYIYICMSMCISLSLSIHTYMYIYIYIYVHVTSGRCRSRHEQHPRWRRQDDLPHLRWRDVLIRLHLIVLLLNRRAWLIVIIIVIIVCIINIIILY